MKNILLGLALLATTITAKAQAPRRQMVVDTTRMMDMPTPAPTTQEEYNYATKGLKIQRSNGLDMKTGYSLVKSQTYKQGVYTVVIEDLVRKADRSLAAIIVEINSSAWPNSPGPRYFCIPNPYSTPDLVELYKQDVKILSSLDIHQAVNMAMAARLSGLSTMGYMRK